MLLTLKGADGGTVIVNSDHILYIGAAVDPATKQPILGHSAIIFSGGFAARPDGQIIQQSLLVRGTPGDISELVKRREEWQGMAVEART